MSAQQAQTVIQTSLPDLPVRRGKVRDVYDLGDELLIVSTDRISAYDVVLPTPIPGKGELLTRHNYTSLLSSDDDSTVHWTNASAPYQYMTFNLTSNSSTITGVNLTW